MARARVAARPGCPPTLPAIISRANKMKEGEAILSGLQRGGPSVARGDELTIESPIYEVGSEKIQTL